MRINEQIEMPVKINSREFKDAGEFRNRIEKILDEGSLPMIQHFSRDAHLEVTIEIAFRHKLTVLLNPQQTECHFRRRP